MKTEIYKRIIRVALYMRVSTEEQALHGLSLDAQDATLTKYATDNGMIIVDRYVDEGISARKKMSNRKQLLRLLEDVKAGKIDMVIFTKLDRWTRNIYDFHKVQEILDKHKVDWKTTNESYDTTTATGRLQINLMLAISQDEADRTSERIKAVFANKVQKKEYLNGKIPFGFVAKDSKLYKDPETEHIVDDLFRKFFETHSLYAAQHHIAETYGVRLAHRSYSKMMKNTIYCGEYRGIKDFCEPYITREQFDEMRNIVAKKNVKNTPTDRVYIFAGLLVCPVCGCRLGGTSTRYKTKDGVKENRSYKCKRYERERSCSFRVAVSESVIEKYLFAKGVSDLEQYEHTHAVEASSKKKAARNTEKVVADIKKKMSKLKELYLIEKIDLDEYERDYDAYRAKLEECEKESVQEERYVDVEKIKKLLSREAEELYYTLTAANRRIFWCSFIDKIVVNDRDDMDIIFVEDKKY